MRYKVVLFLVLLFCVPVSKLFAVISMATSELSANQTDTVVPDEHSLYTLFLFADSIEQQQEALRWFGENSMEGDEAILKEYMSRADISPANRFQAEAILSKLQVSKRMLNPVKHLYGKIGWIGIMALVLVGFSGIYGLTVWEKKL